MAKARRFSLLALCVLKLGGEGRKKHRKMEEGHIQMAQATKDKGSTDEYDSPWKEAIEKFLPDFLAFFFPEAAAGIDWTKGYEFLDKEFQTVKFVMNVNVIDDQTFSYEQDTQIKIKGQSELFHHIDKNTLKRVD